MLKIMMSRRLDSFWKGDRGGFMYVCVQSDSVSISPCISLQLKPHYLTDYIYSQWMLVGCHASDKLLFSLLQTPQLVAVVVDQHRAPVEHRERRIGSLCPIRGLVQVLVAVQLRPREQLLLPLAQLLHYLGSAEFLVSCLFINSFLFITADRRLNVYIILR